MLQFVALVVVVVVSIFMLAGGDMNYFTAMSSSEIASTLFFAIVLSVFVGSVIGAGERLSTIARHMAIALSLTLTALIGWEYRYELQGAMSRITAGVVPGTPISQLDENGDLSVTVSRLDRHFQTLAEVNGTNQPFIIDTGASTVVLTYENARAAGYDVEALNFVIPVSTANGMTRAAMVTIDSLSIGDLERRNIRAMVAQEGQLFENLLGMSFLNRLSGYDVRGTRMILHN
ncbi:MAG: TIGR02281 family clan AA aspartic protease [Pseudomonadota bacterium]